MKKTKLREKLINLKEKLQNSDDSFTKFSKIKKKARENMEGNWSKSATISCISLILSAITVFVISMLFGFIVLTIGIAYPALPETQDTSVTVPENTTIESSNIIENTETTLQNSTNNNTSEDSSIPIQTAPDDYYLTYYMLYILFAALIFIIVYHFYNTIISGIFAVRTENNDVEFSTHFKEAKNNFGKFNKILGRKTLKLIPSFLLINFSYLTYILGIYLTFLINDNWLLLVIASLLLSIIGIAISISVLFNYTFTSFIVYKEPNMDSKNILMKSKLIMHKNKRLFFDFIFSFTGWALLAILTFGVGLLWLIPYYQLSKYYLYEDLKSPENMKNKELKKNKKNKKK